VAAQNPARRVDSEDSRGAAGGGGGELGGGNVREFVCELVMRATAVQQRRAGARR